MNSASLTIDSVEICNYLDWLNSFSHFKPLQVERGNIRFPFQGLQISLRCVALDKKVSLRIFKPPMCSCNFPFFEYNLHCVSQRSLWNSLLLLTFLFAIHSAKHEKYFPINTVFNQLCNITSVPWCISFQLSNKSFCRSFFSTFTVWWFPENQVVG